MTFNDFASLQAISGATVRARCFAMTYVDENAWVAAPALHVWIGAVCGQIGGKQFDDMGGVCLAHGVLVVVVQKQP